jgi:hypothetical protein
MLRAISDEFVVAALTLTSPNVTVERGVVIGLEFDELDAADALAAVARASAGACALRFGHLEAAPGAEDLLRFWIENQLKNAMAFDVRAFELGTSELDPKEGAPEQHTAPPSAHCFT